MHVILEQHEILQIAQNLQDCGILGAQNKAVDMVAEAIIKLIQSRLDDLIDPAELIHLIGKSELLRSLSNLPDEEMQQLDLAA